MRNRRLETALITIVLVGITGVSWCEEHMYCTTISPSHYNDFWESQFETDFVLRYDDSSGDFIFLGQQLFRIEF